MLIRLCNVCIGLGHGTEVREMTNEAKPDNVECPIDTDCKMVSAQNTIASATPISVIALES